MTRQEFLDLTKLGKNTLTFYMNKGIISIHKIGQSYNFTQEHVEQLEAYRRGEQRQLIQQPKPKQDQSVQQSNTPALSNQLQPTEQSQDRKDFNYNCYGESVPSSTGTYNQKALSNAYTDPWSGHFKFPYNFDFQIDFDKALKELLKHPEKGAKFVKGYFQRAKNEPDKPAFDKYYSIPSNKEDRVHSLNDVYTLINNTPKYLKRGYPDFETMFCAAMRYMHSRLISTCSNAIRPTIESHINWHHYMDNILDMSPTYAATIQQTFEPIYHKPTLPLHGKNKPKLVNSENQPVFPDEIEDLRYQNKRNKVKYPDNPELYDGWRSKFLDEYGFATGDDGEYKRLTLLEIEHMHKRNKFYEYYEIDKPKAV